MFGWDKTSWYIKLGGDSIGQDMIKSRPRMCSHAGSPTQFASQENMQEKAVVCSIAGAHCR
jgi:hypothetical protein